MFVMNGGVETFIVFNKGINIPYFSSFQLLRDETGCEILREHTLSMINMVNNLDAGGLILEVPTWRASRDWADKLGIDAEQRKKMHDKVVGMYTEMRDEMEKPDVPIVIAGQLGPRGDGYKVGDVMTVDEAMDYHKDQLQILKDAGADMASILTITYVEEAMGAVKAAHSVGMPFTVSFTVETDGKLPSGMKLSEAIEQCESQAEKPLYYLINCAHPNHLRCGLTGEECFKKLWGLRCNPSKKSHAELNQSTKLDSGNIPEFAEDHVGLKKLLPWVKVVGGCCGSNANHTSSVYKSLSG